MTSEYDIEKENREKSYNAYLDCLNVLKKYSQGETNPAIRSNFRMVLDGLVKIIGLKEREKSGLTARESYETKGYLRRQDLYSENKFKRNDK